MGPVHLRSLEGTVTQYTKPPHPTIGILVSAQPYTKEAEAQWRRSALPLVLVTIDPVSAIEVVKALEEDRESGVEDDGTGGRAGRERRRLVECLRRFSLNPPAVALLPRLRVRKVAAEGKRPPYITVAHGG